MTDSRRSSPTASGSSSRATHVPGVHVDAGNGQTWRPSALYLLVALGLAGAGLVGWWLLPPAPGDAGRPTAIASASAELASASGAAQSPVASPGNGQVNGPVVSTTPALASRLPEGDADPTRDLSSYVMRGEKPTMPEVIERLHKAGIHEGLGAFSPPGTRPPMIGLAVPEDFVLPDGYVRHHQATDDGQRIEAILMFAPDRQILDASGKPVPIPKNRVVPPEYAPPGLPIRRITLPKPIEPEAAGR